MSEIAGLYLKYLPFPAGIGNIVTNMYLVIILIGKIIIFENGMHALFAECSYAFCKAVSGDHAFTGFIKKFFVRRINNESFQKIISHEVIIRHQCKWYQLFLNRSKVALIPVSWYNIVGFYRRMKL